MTLTVPLLFHVAIPQGVTHLFLASGAVLIPYVESSSTHWCSHLNRVILLHQFLDYGNDGVYDK